MGPHPTQNVVKRLREFGFWDLRWRWDGRLALICCLSACEASLEARPCPSARGGIDKVSPKATCSVSSMFYFVFLDDLFVLVPIRHAGEHAYSSIPQPPHCSNLYASED